MAALGLAVIDPSTGLPIDASAPTVVELLDSGALSASRSSSGMLFESVDLDGYQGATLHVVNAGTNCTLTYRQSNDGTTWQTFNILDDLSSSGVPQSTSSSASVFKIPKAARYVQVEVTSYGSGTVSAVLNRSNAPFNIYTSVSARPRANSATALSPTNARIHSAASANATVVKASSAVLNHLQVANTGAALAYLKLYSKATAPTSSDTPALTIPLPANGLPVSVNFPAGMSFASGIGYRIVTGAADSDNTSVTADQVTGTIGYS